MKEIIDKIIKTYNDDDLDYQDKSRAIKGHVNTLNSINLDYEQKEELLETLEEEGCDILRLCGTCDKFMSEGICVEGHDTYCSEECFVKDGFTMEEFKERCNYGKGDIYYTDWI